MMTTALAASMATSFHCADCVSASTLQSGAGACLLRRADAVGDAPRTREGLLRIFAQEAKNQHSIRLLESMRQQAIVASGSRSEHLRR